MRHLRSRVPHAPTPMDRHPALKAAAFTRSLLISYASNTTNTLTDLSTYPTVNMCGSDIFLGILAILFPPLAVWVKRGICSADSLINIALCCTSSTIPIYTLSQSLTVCRPRLPPRPPPRLVHHRRHPGPHLRATAARRRGRLRHLLLRPAVRPAIRCSSATQWTETIRHGEQRAPAAVPGHEPRRLCAAATASGREYQRRWGRGAAELLSGCGWRQQGAAPMIFSTDMVVASETGVR